MTSPSTGASKTRTIPWWQSWWAIVGGLVLFAPLGLIALWKRPGLGATPKWIATGATALIVALALALPNDTTTSTATGDRAGQATTPAVSTSPSAAPTPEPTTAAVPSLVGLTRAEAKAALRDAGLAIGTVERQPSSQKAGTVLQQGSAPGASLDTGAPVTIILAAPLPKIPSLVGTDKASALSQLQAAGFGVKVSTKTTTSGADNVVISETPSGGTRAEPGAVVALVISDLQKPPTLSSASSSNCTPGYSPCLPPASDYDCQGGSGDGPKYTGLVHVSGSDPYDLDRDGDGVGCD